MTVIIFGYREDQAIGNVNRELAKISDLVEVYRTGLFEETELARLDINLEGMTEVTYYTQYDVNGFHDLQAIHDRQQGEGHITYINILPDGPDLNDEDLVIEVYRSSGIGPQTVGYQPRDLVKVTHRSTDLFSLTEPHNGIKKAIFLAKKVLGARLMDLG